SPVSLFASGIGSASSAESSTEVNVDAGSGSLVEENWGADTSTALGTKFFRNLDFRPSRKGYGPVGAGSFAGAGWMRSAVGGGRGCKTWSSWRKRLTADSVADCRPLNGFLQRLS